LTDNRKLDSIDYCDELIAMAGIDRDKLPRLVEMGSSVGVVQKEIAEAIGLAADTTVFAGINDTQAVAVGAGTFRGSHGGINIGTTCQVLGFVDHMHSDLANGLVAMPGPIPGRYTVMAENGLGGKTIEHFLTNIVFASDPLADHSVEDPFAGMEATLETTRAGSRGTLYLPWLAGASSPQSSATTRGGFLNVSLKTTRADMLRSVLEGVAMSLRWLLPAVETFSGTQFDALRFAGGGARSATWSQIFADVMNRPVLQLEESRQANNRGCALLAFDRLGIRSLDDIEMFCPIQQTYEPIPENRDLFAARFEQFVAVFEQTRPIFEALNG
jgi:xylulokinase